MDPDIRKRYKWVELFNITGSASLVCLRCGISRPTLRKWVHRYQQFGLEGLRSRSTRPNSCPSRKLHDPQLEWIRQLRLKNLGPRRIQSELRKEYGFSLALASIHKALHLLGMSHLKPVKRSGQSKSRRYQKKTPGECVQVDNCKIGPKLYQFTAIDDCSRLQVMRLYPNRTAASSNHFLQQMVEEFPFPVQRVQTDRGEEFFATAVQYWLMEQRIKFRPIKPRSPHLNGKVERVQRTDREEFYAQADVKSPQLPHHLTQWQEFYNKYRAHGSLCYKTPWQRWEELQSVTPSHEEIRGRYDPS